MHQDIGKELKGDHESRIAEPLGWLDVLEDMKLGRLRIVDALFLGGISLFGMGFGWVSVRLSMILVGFAFV